MFLGLLEMFYSIVCFFIGHSLNQRRKHRFIFGDLATDCYYCTRCNKIIVGNTVVIESAREAQSQKDKEDQNVIDCEFAVGEDTPTLPCEKVDSLQDDEILIRSDSGKEVLWNLDGDCDTSEAVQEQIGNILYKTESPNRILVNEHNWELLNYAHTAPPKGGFTKYTGVMGYGSAQPCAAPSSSSSPDKATKG